MLVSSLVVQIMVAHMLNNMVVLALASPVLPFPTLLVYKVIFSNYTFFVVGNMFKPIVTTNKHVKSCLDQLTIENKFLVLIRVGPA